MRISTSILLAGAATLALTGGSFARVQAGDASALALDRVISPAVQPLTVTSPAARPDEQIPEPFTALGKNVSPPVAWSDAPQGVGSYVVVMEDPDSHGSSPTLHWLVYNIPGKAAGLSKNMRNRGEPKSPAGAMQGLNSAGGVGYVGPHPPQGDPPHHYHIEVFALDRVLDLPPKLSLDKVIAAMTDHVLAEGQTVGTFAEPSQASSLK